MTWRVLSILALVAIIAATNSLSLNSYSTRLRSDNQI